QVRVVFNIVELARAIIGEITSKATRRLEKILALRLCQSPELLFQQMQMFRAFLKTKGNEIKRRLLLTEPEDRIIPWECLQYLRYYLPAEVWAITGEPRWQLVSFLVNTATGQALLDQKTSDIDPTLLDSCRQVWRTIPQTVRCAIL